MPLNDQQIAMMEEHHGHMHGKHPDWQWPVFHVIMTESDFELDDEAFAERLTICLSLAQMRITECRAAMLGLEDSPSMEDFDAAAGTGWMRQNGRKVPYERTFAAEVACRSCGPQGPYHIFLPVETSAQEREIRHITEFQQHARCPSCKDRTLFPLLPTEGAPQNAG